MPGREEHAERFDPATTGGTLVDAEHRCRYWWAAQFVADKDVLDAGCGVGYGTEILADGKARAVHGIDISREAIEDCGKRAREGVSFSVGDVTQLPFSDGEFDVVVCFEVIEHILEQDAAISGFARALRPDGLLVISSPNRETYPPGNPYHVREYTPEEFDTALSRKFKYVRLYAQDTWFATGIQCSREHGDHNGGSVLPDGLRSVGDGDRSRENYMIALASNAELPDTATASVVLANTFEPRWWHEQVAERNRLGRGLERLIERQEMLLDQLRAQRARLEAVSSRSGDESGGGRR